MSSTAFQRRLTRRLLDRRNGLTLVELMIAIVILGGLGAIGVPAYLNLARVERENAAERGVIAAAKACAALRATAETSAFKPPSGVTGTCTYSADIFTSTLDGLSTQAVATVSAGGGVVLTTPAASCLPRLLPPGNPARSGRVLQQVLGLPACADQAADGGLAEAAAP
jgi:prepilin-type N-terminal cleavage/methylation domain-containing protein